MRNTRRGTRDYERLPDDGERQAYGHIHKPKGWTLVADANADNPLLVPGCRLVLSLLELTVIRQSADLRDAYAGCTFENARGERTTL